MSPGAGPGADVLPAGKPDLFLVPHTHWDREWYEPFQRFRLRLVELLDQVLDQAEADPRFRFTLDGQTAAVDDYLEVRPENRERLRALVVDGQLAVGPWQILMDEFLCSGENIVRNLERGMTRAMDLGGVMPVGYLPDMFGHCAQMPQVLAGAGLRHACVWRGVPSRISGHAFRWQAPDGSSVRTEYLPAGYGNAAYLFTDPDGPEGRIRDFAARMQPWFGDQGVLAMYGTDHTAPIPDLAQVAARQSSGHSIRVTTLAEYLERHRKPERLPTVRGELRSHARANILPGVLSARRHLKVALRRAERMVERYAEPWAALYADSWPGVYLDLAWDRLVASSCHDSVTGCGADETAVQVGARIAEAGQLGQAVRDSVVGSIAARVPRGRLVAVNPSPHERLGWVAVDVPVSADVRDVVLELPDGRRLASQELGRYEPLLDVRGVPAAELSGVFTSIHGHELFGQSVLDARLEPDEQSLTFTVGAWPGGPPFDLVGLRRKVDEAAGGDGRWTVRIQEQERRRVGAVVPVPALGWSSLRALPGVMEVPEPVRVEGHSLDNGLVRLSVDDHGVVALEARDGTRVADIARLVDGGDRGDTYNYAAPGADRVVSQPVSVAVEILERGPLRGVITLFRDYDWPAGVEWDGDRRREVLVRNVTLTRLEVRHGEPFVRMEVQVDNRCLDHRLRLHVALPRRASTSHAEGQFAVVTRGRTAEGGHGETPTPTFPASGFVDAGDVALLLDGPSEYELVDDGMQLAVTLVRSVGRLSRNVNPSRSEPAGPQLETPGAQCLGQSTSLFAVLPHRGGWHADGVVAAAEHWNHDLALTWATGPVAVQETGAAGVVGPLGAVGLQVEGDGVTMSSLRRRGDWLELRLVVEHPEPVSTLVRGGLTAARRCDLLGRPGEVLDVVDGDLRLVLAPWAIVTLQLQR